MLMSDGNYERVLSEIQGTRNTSETALLRALCDQLQKNGGILREQIGLQQQIDATKDSRISALLDTIDSLCRMLALQPSAEAQGMAERTRQALLPEGQQ